MTIAQALRSSIKTTLFLMLVTLGFLAFVTLPPVGKLLSPIVCEAGETLTSVSTPWSRPGESGTEFRYFCTSAAGDRPIEKWSLLTAALKIHIGFFLLVVWPLLANWKARRAARVARIERDGIPAVVKILSAQETGWRINEAPVVEFALRVEPEGRDPFDKTVRKRVPLVLLPRMQPGAILSGLVDPENPRSVMLADSGVTLNPAHVTVNATTSDTLPPQFAEMIRKAMEQSTAGAATIADMPPEFGEMVKSAVAAETGSTTELDALRTLKAMRDEGLITGREYEAKKAEIMGRM